MKARPEETMEEFPDTPPWTMFFDGPLYQKYDEFMRTKDFSKILLNTKLRLANSPEPEVVSSTHSIEDDHWDKEQDADPTGNTYPYVSEDFYRRSKEEKKRRTRKTRAFILLGLVIMAALAFGTALVIHYFFIPPLEERNPNNFVNVSFATNTTSSNTSEIDQTTTGDFGDDISSLLDAMSKDPHHHDHGHDHEHILNPDGKIFDDHFVTTTGTPPKSSTDYKSPRATTTKAKPTKTAVYVLHLNPKESGNDTGKVTRPPPDDKPKQYTSTVDLNHMDFFGMDDLDTTTYSLSSTETSNDFFAMDDEITTTITKKQSTTQADVLPELKKSQMATRKSIYVGTTTVQSTLASQTSRDTLGTSTAKVKESSTQNEYNTTSTIKPPPATTAAMKETTPNILPSTTTVENVTKPTDSSNTTAVGTESANANYEWVTSILYQTTTIEAVPATSDVLPGNNNTNSSEKTTMVMPETTIVPETTIAPETKLREQTRIQVVPMTTFRNAMARTTTIPLHKTTPNLETSTTMSIMITGLKTTTVPTVSYFDMSATAVETTTVMKTTTSIPEMTKTLPETTTTLPETTTTLPETTTILQETTTTLPETTTTFQETTTTLQKTITTLQVRTTTLPETTTSVPETTPSVPEMTTTLLGTTSFLPETTTLAETTSTLRKTTTTLPETTTPVQQMTTAIIETTTNVPESTTALPETTTTLPETTTTLQETTTSVPETTTTLQETTTTVIETTTTVPETTTLPENYNTVRMRDVTSYTFENANIQCIVKHAIRWQSLSVKINQTWRPLEVTLYPSGDIKWSRSKTKRHDVSYDITNSTDGTGSNMTLGLIINDVQCRDANTYICTLRSEIVDRVAAGKLIVVGKPSQKITLTFGPAIIEDRAFRITASWQGGYPVPWTNISWTAVDANNRSHNLAEYGEYRDYELHEDHQFCQTTLEHSIVVFPKIHLNDTTVIVRPNLKSKRFFVDKSMEKYLEDVEPGIDKILVIPMDYCKNSKKEASLPHPYTPCSKFLRCLPGDMVVQLCPMGTCFVEKSQECA